MTENTLPQTSPPQTAPAPAPVVSDAATHGLPSVTAASAASVTATAAAATAAVNNSLNGAGEQLPCQWVGCSEKSPTAEALYVRIDPEQYRHCYEDVEKEREREPPTNHCPAPDRNTFASAMSVVRAPTT